jgi:hypothetical protein
MAAPIIFSGIFFLIGAVCLIWTEQMCAFAASRSPWEWHRRLTLSQGNVALGKSVGFVTMVCSAYVMWTLIFRS